MTALIYLVNYVMATVGGFFEMLWFAIAYKYRVITILLLVFMYFYAMYQVMLLPVLGLLILVIITIAAFVLFLIAAKAAVDARKKSDRGWVFHFALLAIWQAINVVWGVLLSLEVWSMI